MDNFFNYVSKPVPSEDVDVWIRVNNIIPEKMRLYSDFTHTLNIILHDTYLGEEELPNDTRINLTEEDKNKHFDWCWNKTVDIFSKEKVIFEKKGEHYDYYKTFYDDIFYNQKDKNVRDSVEPFFNDLFDMKKTFTKSDLDMLVTIYKLLEKNMKIGK